MHYYRYRKGWNSILNATWFLCVCKIIWFYEICYVFMLYRFARRQARKKRTNSNIIRIENEIGVYGFAKEKKNIHERKTQKLPIVCLIVLAYVLDTRKCVLDLLQIYFFCVLVSFCVVWNNSLFVLCDYRNLYPTAVVFCLLATINRHTHTHTHKICHSFKRNISKRLSELKGIHSRDSFLIYQTTLNPMHRFLFALNVLSIRILETFSIWNAHNFEKNGSLNEICGKFHR